MTTASPIQRTVKLDGPTGPIRELQRSLKGATTIREDSGVFYLESATFAECKTIDELFLDAERLANSINGVHTGITLSA